MKRSDFEFALPQELIAQRPNPERVLSRLLDVVNSQHFVDRLFADLPQLLRAGDVLILNNAKVINARFFGRKDTGGRVEVVIDHIQNATTATAQVRASKSPKAGARLFLNGSDVPVSVLGRENESLFCLKLPENENWWNLCERFGQLPLPPYIAHAPDASDAAQYQTVYAATPGAVAAPTAGLHFDEKLLKTLAAQGVEIHFLTLFVGAGTYQPVRVENLRDHKMHREAFEIPASTAAAVNLAKAENRRVVAVGTTTLRALEASALKVASENGDSADSADSAKAKEIIRAGADSTDIFLYPGANFRVVDALITNFHLPSSTLLMLVAAFAGFDVIQKAYQHAITQKYRFFSYGDAMFLRKKDAAE